MRSCLKTRLIKNAIAVSLLEFSGAIIIFGRSSYNRSNHSYSFAMNIKTQLLEAIEQAPDSVIQETFNFLLSAQSDNLHSQSAGEAILSLLNQTPLNPEDLKNLPNDLADRTRTTHSNPYPS